MTEKPILRALIPFHLGELITAKYHLDTVKNKYQMISFCFDQDNWDRYFDNESSEWANYKEQWNKYIDDIGQLFFNEPPYVITKDKTDHVLYHTCSYLISEQGIAPMVSRLPHLLCQGTPLDLGEEYIVVTTKARTINMERLYERAGQFINVLKKLSQKYKIVVLGEKVVEQRKEYRFEEHQNRVFSIYDIVVDNITPSRVLDLTVPTLGNTPYNLKSIQQDCLLMQNAKFVITFGCGGNCVMSLASATMAIGYREDNIPWNDILFDNKEYPTASISNNWEYFLDKLSHYC
jgi:hypothetical protein